MAAFIIICIGFPTNIQKSMSEVNIYPFRGSPEVLDIQIFVCEFIGSFLYIFIYYFTIIDKKKISNIHGFALGSIVIFTTMSFKHISGGCVNAVRIIGPYALAGHGDQLMLYIFS